jgi:carbonic anhydrase
MTLAAILLCPALPAAEQHSGPSAAEALQKLVDGNKRYVHNKMAHPHQNGRRRSETVAGQHPFAIVLSCSDSRVPPEMVFDQGFGDLFVVRTAGNITDDISMGSLEYGAEHLHVPLIVVLGHEHCGAVEATLQGGEAPGHIGKIVESIRPAVDSVKGKPGDTLHNCVVANVERVVAQLKASDPILASLIHEHKLSVVGARYSLDTGAIEVLQ